jgi:hypothetical protein
MNDQHELEAMRAELARWRAMPQRTTVCMQAGDILHVIAEFKLGPHEYEIIKRRIEAASTKEGGR